MLNKICFLASYSTLFKESVTEGWFVCTMIRALFNHRYRSGSPIGSRTIQIFQEELDKTSFALT